MKLTKGNVETLALPAGKSDAIFFDDALPGFGVRVRSGGRKTWIAQYRANGRQRRETIGRVDSVEIGKARKAAQTIFAKVSLDRDPQAERATARAEAARSLRSVVDLYITAAEPRLRPSSMTELRRYLLVHFATLGKAGINTIQRGDVAVALNEIKARSGPMAADRARVTLSGLFSWAIREGIATSNPVIFTNRPAKPRARERVLSMPELGAVWKACDRDEDFDQIVRLLILTGQRRGEVADMEWAELDLDAATWVIPSDRTKNAKAHSVPLSDGALMILGGVKRRDHRERLFGHGDGGFSGWSRAKARLDGKLAEVAAWTVHDLRRSFATHLGDMGIAPHVVEALLNHVGSKAGVAGVYNRSLYAAEKRAAMVLWSDRIVALVTGKPAVVTPLRGSAL